MRRLIIAAILIGTSFGPALWSQTKSAPKQLSPKEQLALRLLTEATAAAQELPPPSRAALLFVVGNGLQTLSAPLAQDALDGALRAIDRGEQEDVPGLSLVEATIIAGAARLNPSRMETNLPEDQRLRDVALSALTGEASRAGEFQHALQLLRRIEREPNRWSPGELILSSLPKGQEEFRATVFSELLEGYKQNQHGFEYAGWLQDFTHLVLANAGTLPPALVKDAVEEILKQADSADAMNKKDGVYVNTKAGAKRLSLYEYRLAQMMPILRKIDPERAAALAKRNEGLYKEIGDSGVSLKSVAPNEVDSSAALSAASFAARSRSDEELIASSEKNAKATITRVAGEKEPRVRDRDLVTVAQALSGEQPAAAIEALRRLHSLTGDNIAPRTAKSAAEVAIKVGEIDMARTFLKRGMRSVRPEYEKEASRDNPNRALKLYWVSAHEWKNLLLAALAISPEDAVALVEEIPDEEIVALQKARLAYALLNRAPAIESSPMQAYRNLR